MPVVHLRINVELSQEQKKNILLAASQLVASTMGKPLADVMVIFSYDELMLGGEMGPATFIDLKCVSGISVDMSKKLCEGLYNLLQEVTNLKSSRVYINFFEVNHVHAWRFINDVAVCAGQSTFHN